MDNTGKETLPHCHGIGRRRSARGRYARVVDRMVLHGPPLSFRSLCERVVPRETRYLVLDLDRTVHLGRNLGELLGWQLCAHLAYGDATSVSASLALGRPGRFQLDWSRPAGVFRYVALGAQMWAYPGLYYLLWGKLAPLTERTRRWSFRRFGEEPVRRVQRVPQTALLHHMTRVSTETLRELAAAVWERHAGDQVITRADLDWLRERCPGVTIVLSSASSRPMVAYAAERLGVDHVDHTTIEEHEGRMSAPVQLHRRVGHSGRPHRFAPTGGVRINSSYEKLERLRARFADLADPDTVSVGISDTGYGEDHCWTEAFTHVVDINSDSPFPPIVTADSPLREVHSAAVLSRSELARLGSAGADAGVGEDYLDPRRPDLGGAAYRELSGDELRGALRDLLDDTERLAERRHRRALSLETVRRAYRERAETAAARVDEFVRKYNDSEERERSRFLEEMDRWAAQLEEVTRAVTRVEQPLSELAYHLSNLTKSARARVDGPGRSPDVRVSPA